jgi:hypothetical protein
MDYIGLPLQRVDYMANLTFRNAEPRICDMRRSTALLAARINTLPGPARPWVVTSWHSWPIKIEMTWKILRKISRKTWGKFYVLQDDHLSHNKSWGYTRMPVVYPFMSLGRLRDRLQMTPNCEDLSWYNSEGLIMVKPMLTGNGWPNDEKEHMHT